MKPKILHYLCYLCIIDNKLVENQFENHTKTPSLVNKFNKWPKVTAENNLSKGIKGLTATTIAFWGLNLAIGNLQGDYLHLFY